jgi:hypothetical protein
MLNRLFSLLSKGDDATLSCPLPDKTQRFCRNPCSLLYQTPSPYLYFPPLVDVSVHPRVVAGRADGVLRLRVQDDDVSIGADRDDALPGVQVENLGAAQRARS